MFGLQVLEPLVFEQIRVRKGKAIVVQFSCLAQNNASGERGGTGLLIVRISNTDNSPPEEVPDPFPAETTVIPS